MKKNVSLEPKKSEIIEVNGTQIYYEVLWRR